ncbi:MAG: ATP-binding protein [Deltaproteobacteria bacterium]|nr:ATP-binding protein [Deltaproteobacteria bacterium]
MIATEADHSLVKKLAYYQSPSLLCIDEIGYLPSGPHGSNLFFQVISSRHQNKSTVITTNLLCGAPHNKFNAVLIIMRSYHRTNPANRSF